MTTIADIQKKLEVRARAHANDALNGLMDVIDSHGFCDDIEIYSSQYRQETSTSIVITWPTMEGILRLYFWDKFFQNCLEDLTAALIKKAEEELDQRRIAELEEGM
jgi:hypothetical protein